MIYAAYGPRTSEAEARAAFVRRYGVEPQIVKKLNIWLLGPKSEGGRDGGVSGVSTTQGGLREPTRV